MGKLHLVTVEHLGERTNIVVEISEKKIIASGAFDPESKERAQCGIAFKLACAFLRKEGDTRLFTQVYNREITRANFSAEYGPEMIAPDGSKGWIVTAGRRKK